MPTALETGAVDGTFGASTPRIGSPILVVCECDEVEFTREESDEADMDFDNGCGCDCDSPERGFIAAERLFAAQFCEREP